MKNKKYILILTIVGWIFTAQSEIICLPDYQEEGVVPPSPPSAVAGLTVEQQIRQIARKENFDDEYLLVRIAECESSLNPLAKNKNSSATGLYQILDLHKLSVEDRQDIETSTKWVINKINNGGLSAWNASRECWK